MHIHLLASRWVTLRVTHYSQSLIETYIFEILTFAPFVAPSTTVRWRWHSCCRSKFVLNFLFIHITLERPSVLLYGCYAACITLTFKFTPSMRNIQIETYRRRRHVQTDNVHITYAKVFATLRWCESKSFDFDAYFQFTVGFICVTGWVISLLLVGNIVVRSNWNVFHFVRFSMVDSIKGEFSSSFFSCYDVDVIESWKREKEEKKPLKVKPVVHEKMLDRKRETTNAQTLTERCEFTTRFCHSRSNLMKRKNMSWQPKFVPFAWLLLCVSEIEDEVYSCATHTMYRTVWLRPTFLVSVSSQWRRHNFGSK